MAKQSGLGDGLVVDGIDLSGDTGSLGSISSPHGVTDVTGIDASAHERLHLTRDGQLAWSSWFNPAAAHPELSALPTTDRIVTYLRGRALGSPAAAMVAKQINYDPTRNADGSLSFAVQALANGFGLEWGRQLAPGIHTVSGAGALSGVHFGAGTNAGMAGYLHVLAFTGTDADVIIEHSQDDGAVDPYAPIPGSQFSQVTTAPFAERSIAFGLTNEQWLRVNVTTSAGFASLTFAVAAHRF